MVKKSVDQAIKVFCDHHGRMRTQQAIRMGIAPCTLYELYDTGVVIRESRGLYRLAEIDTGGHSDLIQAALRIPNGVICLISALSFHELTTQIPHQIYVAIPRLAEKPRLEYPPVRFFWLSQNTYSTGIEVHELEGIPVKIYAVEKTIVDCFKFRNKVGLDVAIEALRDYRRKGKFNPETLLHYAQIDRVERIIKPYLEAMI